MDTFDKTISQLTIPTPFAVGDTHAYLLKGDLLTLIDAGVNTKQAKEALVSQLSEIGYNVSDIEQIVLTHHHPDHTGLIEAFPRLKYITAHPDVDLWLSRNQSFFERSKLFFKSLYCQTGIASEYHYAISEFTSDLHYAGKGRLTNPIGEGDSLPGHPGWEVIGTYGHAQTHLSFLRTKDRSFIGGDHLLKHISPSITIEAPAKEGAIRPKPMLQYRESLMKCLSLDLKTVLPGHGEIFTNANEIIHKRMVSQERRSSRVYRLLQTKSLTPFGICKQLFPRYFEKRINLTMSETIGQLDYLEEKGLVDYMIEDGVMNYYAK
ncbi:MBL fold metallo-hydrolase [Oceanobacillus massiliensis]|uniref:MBL fold metallo-hydrolase n=1 Tax=Oceanobacillus massiliensis TaxID=1465765 RepID=UPI000287E412|nr:MBL fold metallo-hydrolase [Oceanobacillus massiliensis]